MIRTNLIRLSTRSIHHTPVRYSIVDTTKDVLHKANKKTGEFLAATMETAEKVAPTAEGTAEKVEKTAQDVNKKTGEVLAEGMEKVEKAVPKVNAQEPKQRVAENVKGYKDLQDKGTKAESEQNRPEDGL